MNDKINGIPYAVIQRLRLIDILLDKQKILRRDVIAEYFGLSIQQASHDINLYKEIAPDNLIYDLGMKAYTPTQTFKRVWD
jgi:hypothetical protein